MSEALVRHPRDARRGRSRAVRFGFWGAVWCAGGALALSGCCRSVAEKAVDWGTDGAVKVADGGVTITADGGTMTAGGAVVLPPDWPTDVPMHPTAKLRAVTTAGASRTAVFTSPDAPAAIVAFYKSHLPGYASLHDLTGPDGGTLSKRRGKVDVTINVSKADDGSAQGAVTVTTRP
jgi:hypothetical protein